LVEGILNAKPTIELGLFLDAELVASGEFAQFEGIPRVEMVPLRDPSLTTSARPATDAEKRPSRAARGRLWRAGRRTISTWPLAHAVAVGIITAARVLLGISKQWYWFSLSREASKRLDAYDLVYLPFPYYLKPTRWKSPCVGTFHDVNHKHFPQNFNPALSRLLDMEVGFWTNTCARVVTSTHFMNQDLSRHYRFSQEKGRVVYVAPYSHRPISDRRAQDLIAARGLAPQSYLLYPASIAQHKNVLALLKAVDRTKRESPNWSIPLVLTGNGTDGLGRASVSHPYLREMNAFLEASSLRVGKDVLGLGYVSDEEVDALTRMAGLVVSTSLYEAGCGPALDAWQFGVPVAFSAIPPFLEQLEALGTLAWTFDPTDPETIAGTLREAWENECESQRMATASQRAISRYTWREAAEGYLAIFREVLSRAPDAGKQSARQGYLC